MRLAAALALAAAVPAARGFSRSPAAPPAASARRAEATAAVAEAPPMAMTYPDIQRLGFRALQRECRDLGLPAGGTTAALRDRLRDHHGLVRTATGGLAERGATPAEIEVRRPPRRAAAAQGTGTRGDDGDAAGPVADEVVAVTASTAEEVAAEATSAVDEAAAEAASTADERRLWKAASAAEAVTAEAASTTDEVRAEAARRR